jgi:hypothetical protein
MRLRSLLLGLILASLLLGLPGIAVASANSYHASSASLRTLWSQDLAAGISPGQLAPLRSELAAADASTLMGFPTLTFNPSASQALLDSLLARTNAIYASSLTTARSQALAARDQLLAASGPLTVNQSHALREDFDLAQDPADFHLLAASLRLDALLIPLDNSLTTRQSTLVVLLAQAHSLLLPISAPASNLSDLAAYFLSAPTTRYALAPALVVRTDASIASLHNSITAGLAKRAAARARAAAAARARAAWIAYNAPLYLTLNGYYNDCTGATKVQPGLYQWTCVYPTYLLTHNNSTGHLFFALHLGSIVYFQHHRYTVYHIAVVTVAQENARLNNGGITVPLTLETCDNNSGSLRLVIFLR